MNDQDLKKKVQVVVIADNHLLLMEFNNTIPNNYVGYQNITGAVEADESFLAAAQRELLEEAGIDYPVNELDLTHEFFDRWKKQCLEKTFLCCLPKKPEIILSDEHLHFKWVPIEDVRPDDFRFITNYEAFLEAKKFISRQLSEGAK